MGFGTQSCILEFQSDLKATCLVTTNLWLTVQASLHLPLQFNWKDGKSNPSYILSKHWEFASIWSLLSLYSSGREIHMSSLPRERGVTEFQLERVVSIPNHNG